LKWGGGGAHFLRLSPQKKKNIMSVEIPLNQKGFKSLIMTKTKIRTPIKQLRDVGSMEVQ
jgi:hypothetical protein